MSHDKHEQLSKAIKLINNMAERLESGEKIALPVLSAKLEKMAEAHPYDQTIIAFSNIFSKMDNNNKLFITKGEFKDLYKKLYVRNTRFAEYFADELGIKEAVVEAPIKKEAALNNIHSTITDPILVNALETAFDKNTTLKTYSTNIAGFAKNAVASGLDSWNMKADKVSVDAGNEYFIIVRADYNTPKGTTSVLVPVEISKGKVIEPSVFMCNAGPQDLNHVNIKNFLTASAGTKLRIKAEDLLTVLTREVIGTKEIDLVKMAATKVKAGKEHVGDFSGIIGQEAFIAPRADVAIQKSKQADSFAERLSSAEGAASFTLGKDKLNIARDAVMSVLSSFGIKNPQISVVSSDENTIFFGVSLFGGKTAFKVPVKLANNRILNPTILICNGQVGSFSKETISDLFVKNATDSKVVAATSPQHGLNTSELIQNIKTAVAEQNYTKAEDALNILQQSGNEKAYKDAFIAYMASIGGTVKTASKETTCSMVVKTANSSHLFCGHTNLPLHKVYQDEHGDCHPLYRQGMDETYQSAYFMNAKILG